MSACMRSQVVREVLQSLRDVVLPVVPVVASRVLLVRVGMALLLEHDVQALVACGEEKQYPATGKTGRGEVSLSRE